jgi:hypothetical protein
MGRVAVAESLCLPPLPMLTTSQTEDAGRERRGARVTFSSACCRGGRFELRFAPAAPEDSSWGQFCNTGVCIHPEWIVIGAGLITFALAVFVLKPQRGERQP